MPSWTDELQSFVDERATNDRNAKRAKAIALTSEEIAERVAETGFAPDDGKPPAPPQNVTVLPQMRAAIVDWDVAPLDDQVQGTEIRCVELSDGIEGAETLHYTTLRNYRVSDLTPDTTYHIYLYHVDRFERESEEVGPYPVVPNPSVADEVDLERTRIIGELGFENIEQLTDATKLAAGLVKTHILADDAVTGKKIQANEVATKHLIANSVTSKEILTGTIIAGNMAAGNAAFINAWMENLAVSSAKIANISADKILAGILRAEIEVSSLGMIRSPGVSLGDGIELLDTNVGIGQPGQDTGSGITNRGGKFARFGFFSTVGFGRGASLVANGGGDFEGRFDIYATYGGRSFANRTGAFIYGRAGSSGVGEVAIGNRLTVDGDIAVKGNLQTNGGFRILPNREVTFSLPGGGSTVTVDSFAGNVNLALVTTQYFLGGWRDFIHNTSGFTVRSNTDGTISIANNNPAAYSMRVCFYG